MPNSRSKKAGALLSAAVALSVFAQHAEAYFAFSFDNRRSPITRVDDRSYRHCHNLPARVVCYSSLSGTHKIMDPPEIKPHKRPLKQI